MSYESAYESSYEDGYINGWQDATERSLEVLEHVRARNGELQAETDRHKAAKEELLQVVDQELGIDLTKVGSHG